MTRGVGEAGEENVYSLGDSMMRITKSALLNSSFHMSLLAALVLPPLAAQADSSSCPEPGRPATIFGKIVTNSMPSGDTLGVLQGTIDGSTKLKCGIHGKPVVNPDGTPGFTHSVVCEDSVTAENMVDTVHSQVISASRYDGLPSVRSCGIPNSNLVYGTFREISDPQSGRGIFSPTGGGRLYIDGAINCAGAVDMKFSGTVCVVR